MGFEPQVMRVIDNCRPYRQTVRFSATIPRWAYLKVMRFQLQVMRVIDNCRPDLQTVMFSATFPRWV
jgi:superfamily II DNA/RNA helicase